MMQLYLDSANLEEIEEALSWGVIRGITTNTTLMAKETGIGASGRKDLQDAREKSGKR